MKDFVVGKMTQKTSIVRIVILLYGFKKNRKLLRKPLALKVQFQTVDVTFLNNEFDKKKSPYYHFLSGLLK